MVSNIRQSVRSVRQSVKNSGVSVSVSNSVNKTVSFMTKQINKFSKLATDQLVSQSRSQHISKLVTQVVGRPVSW